MKTAGAGGRPCKGALGSERAARGLRAHRHRSRLHHRQRRQRPHADALLGAALPLELDGAVRGGEERVVAAEADVGARIDARAILAHDDGARAYELAIEALHAAHLGLAVAAVTRAADALFMCHMVPASK